MILIIDNYDSFVHNIARYLVELGERVVVKRNDEVTNADFDAKAVVISPGPCTPHEAGVSCDVVRQLSGRVPLLGVCLGHQVMGEVFGARVTRAVQPMHGEASRIRHDGKGVFAGLPQDFDAGRYHSLIVDRLEGTPLVASAWSEAGEVMGLRHVEHPTHGVQFHPESVLTEHGYDMFRNFLKVVQ